jgi:geranylgeranyl diphosphate synthase, type II
VSALETSAFDLGEYLKARSFLIEQALSAKIPESSGPERRLFEAMSYSLMAGGKRLRPILVLAASEAVGGSIGAAMPFACAVEMIHTYSLIHDDLPCMDDDDLRRGRPTNHKVFGEAIATLAGDGLLTDAFKVITEAAANGVAADVVVCAIAELAEAAGSTGMVGGQTIDLISEGRAMTSEDLEYLHRRKTGALFVASVCGGARLGGATESELSALREYARALGLAFQVIDDLLDVEQSAEQMGKQTHKDEARGKMTYPAVIGIEATRELARKLSHDARRALESFDNRAEPLRALARFTVERTV